MEYSNQEVTCSVTKSRRTKLLSVIVSIEIFNLNPRGLLTKLPMTYGEILVYIQYEPGRLCHEIFKMFVLFFTLISLNVLYEANNYFLLWCFLIVRW